MLERKSTLPKLLKVLVLSIGIAGCSMKNEKGIEIKQDEQIEANTIKIEAEDGKTIKLDITKLPNYNKEEYHGVFGSSEGDIDTKNIISPMSKDIENVDIKIPEGDNIWGYAYFVGSGDKISDNTFKIKKWDRVVYDVLPKDSVKGDNKKYFKIK